jgi:N-formylmaleamate deformylase
VQSRFYVSVSGIKLHYLEHGTAGPVVVLIPGITTPAILWSFVSARIGSYARVITLDNRGRGLSDRGPGLSYGLDDYAADTAGLIETLGLSKPIVLGHSLGARIGIRLAARYPHLVGSLLLADPPVSGPGRRPYPVPLEQYLDRLERASAGLPLEASPLYTGDHARLRAEWLPTCDRDAVIATHAGFNEEDIVQDLAHVACRALLLYAEEGNTISDADADEIVARLQNGTHSKILGVGHMMPWYDLELFLSKVEPFIRDGSGCAEEARDASSGSA